MNYKALIKDIQDYPVQGVSFKDISPLLISPYFKEAIIKLGSLVNLPDLWVGIDARGFLFAAALANQFGGGIVMCRKKGKLPESALTFTYQTEYSRDELCVYRGSGKVVIVDDVLATGGTMSAAAQLCEQAGYDIVDYLVLIDLLYLPKRGYNADQPFDLNVKSLIQYE